MHSSILRNIYGIPSTIFDVILSPFTLYLALFASFSAPFSLFSTYVRWSERAGCSSCIFWEDFELSPSMLTYNPLTDANDMMVRPLYNELLRDYEIPSRGVRIKRLRFHSAIATLKKPSFSEGVFENFNSLEFAE